MRYAGPCAGRAILIQGAGLLGLTAAAMARADGAREVIVCDKVVQRVERAGGFGATRTVLVDDGGSALRGIVDQATSGRGVDLAIDLSGDPAAAEAGIELLRIGGVYVWVGAVFPARPVSLSAETVVRRMLRIQGVHNYAPDDLGRALRFLQDAHSRFAFEELVAETFPLEEADAAFLRASRSGALRVAVKG
jgi:alcohol dehydrogenase